MSERIGCGESRIRDWDLWEALLSLLDVVKRTWNVEVLFWWVPPNCTSPIKPYDPFHWTELPGNRDAKSLASQGLKIPPPRVTLDRRDRRGEMTSSESLGSRY